MISFILPVYDCSKDFCKGFLRFRQYLDNQAYFFEFIVVDDGSNHWKDLQSFVVTQGGTFLRNAKNRGKGYSIKRGIEVARGDIVIFMDGDFPFDFVSVTCLVEQISKSTYDIVIGDRQHKESFYPTEVPWIRRFGSAICSFIVGNFLVPNLYDTQCGIKGFKLTQAKFLFNQLTVERYSFDVEILYLAKHAGYSIGRIPVIVKSYGTTRVNVIKDGLRMMAAIVKIACNSILGKYDFNGKRMD